LSEAAAHLRDSGEAPLRVFGRPGEYAAAVAESLRGATWVPHRPPSRALRLEASKITAGGVAPITSLDGAPIGDGTPGPIMVALRDRFWALMDELGPHRGDRVLRRWRTHGA
jgi:hypothetical protein